MNSSRTSDKLANARREDAAALRRGKIIVVSFAGALLLIIIVAFAFFQTGEPEPAPAPSVDIGDPLSSLKSGDLSPETLERVLYVFGKAQSNGRPLPELPRKTIDSLIRHWLSAERGFRASRRIVELAGSLPSEAEAWRGFLDNASNRLKLSKSPETLHALSDWLSEFSPSDLGPISASISSLKTFWFRFDPIAKLRDEEPLASKVFTGFLSKLRFHSGDRGDADELLVAVISHLKPSDAAALSAVAPALEKFLPGGHVAKVHSIVSNPDTPDSAFSALVPALGAIGAEGTPRILLTSLQGRSKGAVITALRSLKAWDLEAEASALLTWARNEDSGIGSAALEALSRPGPNVKRLAQAFPSLFPSLPQGTKTAAVRALRECPTELLPLQVLLKSALSDRLLLEAVCSVVHGRPYERIVPALSHSFDRRSFRPICKPSEKSALLELLRAIADKSAGEEALKAYKSELSGGLSEEHLLFAVEVLAAAALNTGDPELADALRGIAEDAPLPAVKSKAGKLSQSLAIR
ncbi:MAG: hypothetical protein Kow00107_07590 [Planctomycetota bacterium]